MARGGTISVTRDGKFCIVWKTAGTVVFNISPGEVLAGMTHLEIYDGDATISHPTQGRRTAYIFKDSVRFASSGFNHSLTRKEVQDFADSFPMLNHAGRVLIRIDEDRALLRFIFDLGEEFTFDVERKAFALCLQRAREKFDSNHTFGGGVIYVSRYVLLEKGEIFKFSFLGMLEAEVCGDDLAEIFHLQS